jgi:very-short-patch-repair endonuclease
MRLADHHTTSGDHKRAKELRRHASPYERKLWLALRQANKTTNLNFRFQQPIHPYFVDFACMKAKLIIELDGVSHDTRHNRDRVRDDYLRQQGYEVVRFSNDDLKNNLSGVAETIVRQAEARISQLESESKLRSPSPNPAFGLDASRQALEGRGIRLFSLCRCSLTIGVKSTTPPLVESPHF